MDTDYIGVVPKTASHLRLWTKRGIARHAKILTTDEAWAIYEELEEKYFNPMQIISMTLTEITAHNANQLVLLEKQQLQLEREIQEVKQEVKQTTEVIEKRTAIAVSKAETVNRRMDKFEDCFKERQPGEYTSGEIAEKLMVYSSNKNPHSQFISKVAKKLFQDKYSRSGSVDIGEGFKKITYHQERIIPYIMEFIETSTNYVTTTDKKGNCLRVYRLFNKNFTVIIYKAA